MIDRRALLVGGLALFAAPAIVRASSLMPVRYYPEFWGPVGGTLDDLWFYRDKDGIHRLEIIAKIDSRKNRTAGFTKTSGSAR